MDIKVDFSYDADRNILFTVDRGEIRTAADIAAFFGQYDRYLEQLGCRVWVVANIDGLNVRGEVAEAYGARAQQTIAGKVLGVSRWGTDSWARMTVRTTSLKANIPPSIHDTRDDAVAAVEAMKQQRSG
jgi:hypothetical protein